MHKRETHKDIELNGRKWRVEKFDAHTGSFIAYKLMTQALPLLPLIGGGAGLTFGDVTKVLHGLPKEDFISLQRDCLAVCKEITGVGAASVPLPVIMPNGEWGVPGLEHDAFTVMILTIHAVVFNMSGFFDASVLKGVGESFRGLSPLNAQT